MICNNADWQMKDGLVYLLGLSKKATIVFLLVILSLGSAATVHGQLPQAWNERFVQITRKVLPGVVNISVWRKKTKKGEVMYHKVGEGSGVIVSPNGFVVTNSHVLGKGNRFRVTLNNGKEYYNMPIGPENSSCLKDPSTDIALIKLKIGSQEKLPSVPMGNSKELRVGEWVIAVGNPFGLRHTVTTGIVSAKGRVNVGFADYENFIQTDAAINPGNSGGALVNLKGELVGVNTAIKTSSGGYQGVSFAIPVNMVKKVSKTLLRYGKVVRGWLGFYIRNRPLSHNFRQDQVEIEAVAPYSPAARAGLRKGDVILSYNKQPLRSFYQLRSLIATAEIGEKIRLSIQRNGQRKSLWVTVGKKPESNKARNLRHKSILLLGLEAVEAVGKRGVQVSYVRPQSPAHRASLRKGDRILEIKDSVVKSLQDYLKAIEPLSGGQKIRVLINREGKNYLHYLDTTGP